MGSVVFAVVVFILGGLSDRQGNGLVMSERQYWVLLALVAAVASGIGVYLGVDLAAVGRALVWLKGFIQ